MSIKVWWNANKVPVACFALAFVWTSAALVALSLPTASSSTQWQDRSTRKNIDVIETCEELHTFMHNGKRYYCAPWARLPDAEAPVAPERVTEEGTTNA